MSSNLAARCRIIALMMLISGVAINSRAESEGRSALRERSVPRSDARGAAAAVKRGSFDSDGVKIYYAVRGEGEPVLLIHGFTASTRMNWELPGVIAALEKDYMVIALDNRGHGESDKPKKREDYGVKMVEDALRLLDHLKIEKAHIVGYSMGGMITLKLLTLHPERAISAVMGGMGMIGERPRSREGDARPGEKNEANPAMMACAESFSDLAITPEQLLAIKTPIIGLVGTEDTRVRSGVDRLKSIRPDIKYIEIEGASHATCCFQAKFKTELKAFLDAHRNAR